MQRSLNLIVSMYLDFAELQATNGKGLGFRENPVVPYTLNPEPYTLNPAKPTLVNWVKFMPEPPGEIRLVHGEAKARQALSGVLN
jgi:metallo-beta-lactamase family protein